MLAPVAALTAAVAAVFFAVVALDLLLKALLPRGAGIFKGVSLPGWIAVGTVGLLAALLGPVAGYVGELPPHAVLGAVLFFWSGCIVYIEARSLFSRGYSLRVLVDLFDSGGSAEAASLKDQYGDGMGIEGILDKRLESISRLGLLRFDGERVGPLTEPGKILAVLGGGMRRLLKLQQVG